MDLQQLQCHPKDRARALFGLEPTAHGQLLAGVSERTFAEGVLLLRDICPAHCFEAEEKRTKQERSWRPDTLG